MRKFKIKPRVREKRRIYKLLKTSSDLPETEKLAQAVMLAATPDERWEMNCELIRSVNLSTFEDRRRAGLGKTYEEQKEGWNKINLRGQFPKFLADQHGFGIGRKKSGSRQLAARHGFEP